jgi:hypothetical protein
LAPDFEASESSRRFNSFLLLQKCTVKRFLGLWQFIIVSFSRQLAFSESGVAGRLAASSDHTALRCVHGGGEGFQQRPGRSTGRGY